MKLKELLKKNRSYRRFVETEEIKMEELEDMVDNVRLSPSPANLQPLKFILVNDRETNEKLFPHLKWAGYLKEWPGPGEGERPSAYIIILGNKEKSGFVAWDYGIALQSILLGAVEKGFGGCTVAACDKPKIGQMFQIPETLEIAAVVALGKPAEKVVIDPVENDDIKYWRDRDQVHHVPKRMLSDLIFKKI